MEADPVFQVDETCEYLVLVRRLKLFHHSLHTYFQAADETRSPSSSRPKSR
jgi:hypothetical protein